MIQGDIALRMLLRRDTIGGEEDDCRKTKIMGFNEEAWYHEMRMAELALHQSLFSLTLTLTLVKGSV